MCHRLFAPNEEDTIAGRKNSDMYIADVLQHRMSNVHILSF